MNKMKFSRNDLKDAIKSGSITNVSVTCGGFKANHQTYKLLVTMIAGAKNLNRKLIY